MNLGGPSNESTFLKHNCPHETNFPSYFFDLQSYTCDGLLWSFLWHDCRFSSYWILVVVILSIPRTYRQPLFIRYDSSKWLMPMANQGIETRSCNTTWHDYEVEGVELMRLTANLHAWKVGTLCVYVRERLRGKPARSHFYQPCFPFPGLFPTRLPFTISPVVTAQLVDTTEKVPPPLNSNHWHCRGQH